MFRRRREARRRAAAEAEAEAERQRSARSAGGIDGEGDEDETRLEEARLAEEARRSFARERGYAGGEGGGGGEDWETPPRPDREEGGGSPSADADGGGAGKALSFEDDSASNRGRTASFQSDRSSFCDDSENMMVTVEARLEKGDHVYRRSKGGLAQVHGIVVSCAPDEDGPLVIADFTGRGYERAMSRAEMRRMKEEVERERAAAEEAERERERSERERESLPWGGRGCEVVVPEEDRGAAAAAAAEADVDGGAGGTEEEGADGRRAEAAATPDVGGGGGGGAVARQSSSLSYGGSRDEDEDDFNLGPQDKLSASERHDLTQDDDDGDDANGGVEKSGHSRVDEEHARIRIVAIHGKRNIRRWKKVKYGGAAGGWFRRSKSKRQSIEAAESAGPGPTGGSTTHRKKTKDEQLPNCDPSALVVSRVMFLYDNQDLLPPRHALLSNSECISVWCKTGRWSTFQVSAYLCATWGTQSKAAFTMAAFASSQTVTVPAAGYMGWLGYTATAPLVAVHPLILPAIAGYGVVSVGVPMYMLRKCGKKWDRTTMRLNGAFWDNAGNEVFVECVRHWSGLEG